MRQPLVICVGCKREHPRDAVLVRLVNRRVEWLCVGCASEANQAEAARRIHALANGKGGGVR